MSFLLFRKDLLFKITLDDKSDTSISQISQISRIAPIAEMTQSCVSPTMVTVW